MTIALWIGLAAVLSFGLGLLVGRLISVGEDLAAEERDLDDSQEWPRHADTWRSRRHHTH